MTNITLSIEEPVYKKMKKHSEIKWSEFVRKVIKKRIEELESLEESKDTHKPPVSGNISSSDVKESILTMLASQGVLKKDWDNRLDERWNNV